MAAATVREDVRKFMDAASRALLLTAKLAGFGDPLNDEERERLAGEAPGEFSAIATSYGVIVSALHTEDGNGTHSAARARRSRNAASGGDGRAAARPSRGQRTAPGGHSESHAQTS